MKDLLNTVTIHSSTKELPQSLANCSIKSCLITSPKLFRTSLIFSHLHKLLYCLLLLKWNIQQISALVQYMFSFYATAPNTKTQLPKNCFSAPCSKQNWTYLWKISNHVTTLIISLCHDVEEKRLNIVVQCLVVKKQLCKQTQVLTVNLQQIRKHF